MARGKRRNWTKLRVKAIFIVLFFSTSFLYLLSYLVTDDSENIFLYFMLLFAVVALVVLSPDLWKFMRRPSRSAGSTSSRGRKSSGRTRVRVRERRVDSVEDITRPAPRENP
jgi:hypothetical protein